MGSLDSLNGIDLNKPQLLDCFLHCFRTRAPRRIGKQSLSI
jgi:hypothetical protein